MIEKALPKKGPPETKKKPPSKSSSKKVGSTGKVRSGYPGEGAKKPKAANGAQPSGPLPVDLEKFSTHVGVDPALVRKVAKRFAGNPKLMGKDRFVGYMTSRFKEMHDKHGMDPSYWGRLYDAAVKSL